jgi:hypothetical protein
MAEHGRTGSERRRDGGVDADVMVDVTIRPQ